MSIPGSSSALFLAAAAAGAGGYQVQRSLRFNSSDSAYLSRTPASAGNRKTWSFSCWVKRGTIGGSYQNILSAANSVSDRYEVYFDTSTNQLTGEIRIGGTGYIITTTQVFRDPSAWYHILVVMDTSQATASNRHKFYVNGTQVTNFASASYPNQDATPQWNAADPHSIGRYQNGASQYLDGYLADIWFLDGLTPTSATDTTGSVTGTPGAVYLTQLGEFSATTGVWQPKAWDGAALTGNSFHLEFADNSSNTATTLGKDTSGNGNNWTPNNLSVTAGAGNDSLVDTPTSYGTDAQNGGEVRGNYCTWNPLDNAGTLANGNLDFSQASAAFRNVRSTFAVSTGKWYWEGTLSAIGGAAYIGIGKSTADLTVNIGAADTWGYVNDGKKQSGNTASVSYGASYTTGDVIGVAFDADNGTLTFYKNGTSQGQAYSGLTSGPYFMMVTGYNGTTWAANFGQRAFAYTAPSGFKALCDTNLPAPVVAKSSTAFDVVTYTGNGSARSITGLAFNPDLVWIKSRSAATDHTLYDAVRGAQARLESNNTDPEVTSDGGLTAFNNNGFTLGTLAQVNTNAATYVAWCWDEAAADGFDIVTYTGNGANRTITHSLGVSPSFMIVKQRTAASATNWAVWHSSLANTEYLLLNSTAAKATGATYWNSTSPTASNFSLGTAADVNTNNGTYVAYLWSPVVGYSSFGSYTADGSTDGPFVFCNFRPRLVIVKATTRTFGSAWSLIDTARNTGNFSLSGSGTNILYASSSNQEFSSGGAQIDILSNGFKVRNNSSDVNDSGTYIYAAFAESPFAYSRAR